MAAARFMAEQVCPCRAGVGDLGRGYMTGRRTRSLSAPSRTVRFATALTVVCLAITPFPRAGASAPRHHEYFRVGAAVESLRPPVPVYSGGFGASPPITKIHDPLQVRALYVSDGKHAVAFAVVD